MIGLVALVLVGVMLSQVDRHPNDERQAREARLARRARRRARRGVAPGEMSDWERFKANLRQRYGARPR